MWDEITYPFQNFNGATKFMHRSLVWIVLFVLFCQSWCAMCNPLTLFFLIFHFLVPFLSDLFLYFHLSCLLCHTPKTGSCHYANFGDTVNRARCRQDNLRCHLWQRNWYYNNYRSSVVYIYLTLRSLALTFRATWLSPSPVTISANFPVSFRLMTASASLFTKAPAWALRTGLFSGNGSSCLRPNCGFRCGESANSLEFEHVTK